MRLLLAACLAAILALPSNRAAAQDRPVLVFAAASLAQVLTDLAERFEAETGSEISLNFAASSTLARQIMAGAPADIFVSANIDWISEVEAAGRLEPDSRIVVARNRLVLIAPGSSARATTAAAALGRMGKAGSLAIGDPAHVPAGIYAKQALQALELWGRVKNSLLPAADVRRALSYVARGEAPLGVVYASDAAAEDRVSVIYPLPQSSHQTIRYPAGLVPPASITARQFHAFLQSPEALRVFHDWGFRRP